MDCNFVNTARKGMTAEITANQEVETEEEIYCDPS